MLARPERFDLPTAWFVVLYSKLSNYLIKLKKQEFFCPILLPYVTLIALFWVCLSLLLDSIPSPKWFPFPNNHDHERTSLF